LAGFPVPFGAAAAYLLSRLRVAELSAWLN
jgi:hypothetical protein